MEKVELTWPAEWAGPRGIDPNDAVVSILPGLGFKAADSEIAVKLAEAHNALVKQHRAVLRVLARFANSLEDLESTPLKARKELNERFSVCEDFEIEVVELAGQAAAIVPDEGATE